MTADPADYERAVEVAAHYLAGSMGWDQREHPTIDDWLLATGGPAEPMSRDLLEQVREAAVRLRNYRKAMDAVVDAVKLAEDRFDAFVRDIDEVVK